jgi:recombinational DNA repair protein RecT
MAEEQQNQVATLDQKIAAAKTVNELFQLPDVKQRFIRNYEAVTGKKDGENRLEQERFAYLQLLADKPDLQQVDKFFHFAALVYAGTTGLSFRDGKLYVIPNGKGLKVQSSPAGKREMFCMMPDVIEAPEAVLVMTGDHFVHDKKNNIVKEHWTTDKSVEKITLDNIRAAYQSIKYTSGVCKDTVVYHDDLVKAKAASKIKSEQGNWGTWPGEMSKKTATNRAFRLYHRYPDNVVLYGDQEEEVSDVDHTVIPQSTESERTDVNQNTGEVMEREPEVKVETKKKRDLLAD